MNVQDFLGHLHAAQSGVHRLPAPAPAREFDTLAVKYGPVPQFVIDLWSRHNGLRYCVNTIPLLWFFPLTPDPESLWAANQSVTEYTRVWRQSPDRGHEWAIGTRNDGRVLILSGGDMIEWDTNLKRKTEDAMSVEEWLDLAIREGAAYMED